MLSDKLAKYEKLQRCVQFEIGANQFNALNASVRCPVMTNETSISEEVREFLRELIQTSRLLEAQIARVLNEGEGGQHDATHTGRSDSSDHQ